jgi:segregation and condensation protein A
MQDQDLTLEEFENLSKMHLSADYLLNGHDKNNLNTIKRHSDNFSVKQGRFEGPYTKILDLIESRKLSISEISLSQIADEYIAYVKSLETINPLDISQFIQVASTLMLIKAKSLLPQMEYTSDEKEEVNTLEKKLELHKELKLAEENIKNTWSKNVLITREEMDYKIERVFMPKSVNVANLFSVAVLTLAKMPNFERLKNVAVRQAIKLEDVIEKMVARISESMTSLKDFAKSFGGNEKEVKKNIIVSFLALLELLRHGKINASENNGDISINKI